MTARQRRVSGKPSVLRRAAATGRLRLRPTTVRAIREGDVGKGNPLATAEAAGLLAMKRTSELLPHCHIVPLTASRVTVALRRGGVSVRAEAEARGPTGVEMEALVGATVALLTVWDMVKYSEKDARGQYPRTSLEGLRVVRKEKGEIPRS
ncbi:MAG: cyclic pyranopterin monophosphate synthase MoaC [Thermoplasmata archaeon]